MPKQASFNFNFSKGFHKDGGPLFAEDGFYRGGSNTVHYVDGRIGNRPGIELLSTAQVKTINDQSDSTNIFVPSLFYGEFNKNDGTTLKAVFLRWGRLLRIYANDGSTYTSDLSSIEIGAPDFSFNLDDVSDEAIYYRTQFEQIENTVVITNSRSPIYKIVWGDKTTGNETFSAFRVELVETNEDLFNLSYAKTLGKEIPGWFSVDIPTKAGTTSYTVFTAIVDAAPGYSATVYVVDSNGKTTYLDPANYTYSESLDSDSLQLTSTITYSSAATGESLRVYLGQDTLLNIDPSLRREEVLISSISKDFAADNSHSPRIISSFAGRYVFCGVDGPLDETDDVSYPALGNKFKKVWISQIFPESLTKEENSSILCKRVRGVFDKDDNVRAFSDGGIIEPDNANKILGNDSFGPYNYIVANNGVWQVSGRDKVFSLDALVIEKIIDDTFVSREPIVSTEVGVFIAGENEVYWINPSGQQPLTRLVSNRIETYYRQINRDRKKQSFIRYDSYNKRIYIFFADSDLTNSSKYDTSNISTEWVVFDISTGGWFNPHTCSDSDWGIIDMVTVPAEDYFDSSDHRAARHRKVNLVVLAKKNTNYTDITLGILEGKPYCADFYGTTYKTSFNANVETFNLLGGQFSILGRRQVARATFLMERTEKGDASNGYYEYPGALYMHKRWDFADNENAGPLYSYTLNDAETAWTENAQQIYFPHKYGFASLGGGKPGRNVIPFKTKVRGRGSTIAFKFGNGYGETELTGTIEEQEKPWGLYGYELAMSEYEN